MSVIHVLRADLELTGPGGVTAPEGNTVGSVLRPSLPLASDGWGGPHLPGTSPAGSLREHAPEARRRELFGDVFEDDGKPGGQGRSRSTAVASAVRVLGTRVSAPEAPRSRRRTAVSGHHAAARAKSLHSRELLPPGTDVSVWFRIDTETADSPLVREVVELLRTWKPRIGGGRTVGLGRAEVVSVRHRTIDLATAEGLRHWLLRGGPDLVDDHAVLVHERSRTPGAAPDEAYLFGRPLEFRIVDALRIGSGTFLERAGRRTGIARLLRDFEDVPVVPGSTWKGIVRSRVAFVLRSVGYEDICSASDDGGPGSCGTCCVCVSFGWSERTGGAGDRTPATESVGGRGRLLFADSAVREGRIRIRNHVVIDRVFGGAREEGLFSEETVEDGLVTLHLRQDGDVPEPVRAALVMALDDLADGRVGIGSGTTRGQGTLAATPGTAKWLAEERPGAARTLRSLPLAGQSPTRPSTEESER
ncbi:RAMP superfamily CRISPR-associated protein [Streptomyces sp. NBC_00102]|uniref:RAMP superfamily CRISPR-associated protein n=1 Tax=Streptomyces sp. NBC_00102 TaxID=2975652 RepID=UPI00225045C5|nr:RAMP superfamily CRISPR-associated protein [Streptomyces sp. NBC_00102]MCX5400803.1 RAMP superfamily CRISPR-associated protein [Streptomyces sp. NBC_00102]